MKANWSCTTCGMYSSRRYSVHRHVNNKHMGYGMVIPFVEYLVGRRNGLYPPQLRPNYGVNNGKSLLMKMEEEAEKIYIHRVAEACFPSPGDPSYNECVNTLKASFLKRMSSVL